MLLADTVRYNVSMDSEDSIDLKRLFYIAKKINLYSFIESSAKEIRDHYWRKKFKFVWRRKTKTFYIKGII